MAAEGEACRQCLSTDCVLQLLLDEKSNSKSDTVFPLKIRPPKVSTPVVEVSKCL